jgi:nucleotide-binding universal stress UspA family protein
MKILFAVDGSARALAALESLVANFAHFREVPRLTLIHVHPAVPYGAAATWVGKETVQRYYDEESDAALSSARDALTAHGIAFDVDKRIGDPATEIAKRGDEGAFDLIALATHGHTALAGLVMGSVTTAVIARSKVPVLLLK